MATFFNSIPALCAACLDSGVTDKLVTSFAFMYAVIDGRAKHQSGANIVPL